MAIRLINDISAAYFIQINLDYNLGDKTVVLYLVQKSESSTDFSSADAHVSFEFKLILICILSAPLVLMNAVPEN